MLALLAAFGTAATPPLWYSCVQCATVQPSCRGSSLPSDTAARRCARIHGVSFHRAWNGRDGPGAWWDSVPRAVHRGRPAGSYTRIISPLPSAPLGRASTARPSPTGPSRRLSGQCSELSERSPLDAGWRTPRRRPYVARHALGPDGPSADGIKVITKGRTSRDGHNVDVA